MGDKRYCRVLIILQVLPGYGSRLLTDGWQQEGISYILHRVTFYGYRLVLR